MLGGLSSKEVPEQFDALSHTRVQPGNQSHDPLRTTCTALIVCFLTIGQITRHLQIEFNMFIQI